MAVRAVVWDMDGTLIDSATVVPDAYITTVTRLGGRHLTRAEVIAFYHVGPPRRMLTELLGRACDDGALAEYHACLRATAARARPYPGIVDALKALRPRLPLAVFTGADRDAALILLEASGLLPYFARVVGGDEVERQKPAPDGILLACEALGVEPAEAAYVGDSPGDLKAARASGGLAVAASWGHLYSAETGRDTADVVLATPHDLVTAVDAGFDGPIWSPRSRDGHGP
jgi:HAD superfamily hydrolase (TIGR01509 family)